MSYTGTILMHKTAFSPMGTSEFSDELALKTMEEVLGAMDYQYSLGELFPLKDEYARDYTLKRISYDSQEISENYFLFKNRDAFGNQRTIPPYDPLNGALEQYVESITDMSLDIFLNPGHHTAEDFNFNGYVTSNLTYFSECVLQDQATLKQSFISLYNSLIDEYKNMQPDYTS